MAVGSGTPYNVYTGNGVTTVFSYGFTVLSAGDMLVTVDGVESTDYTIAGIGDAAGGSITFGTAPANGADVVLRLDIELQRETDYQTNGDLLAPVVNADFDRLWQAALVVADAVSRALRVPEQAVELPTFPAAADRALRLAAFDANGDPTVVTPSDQSAASLSLQLASSANASQGAGMMGIDWAALTYAEGTIGRALQDLIGSRSFPLYVSPTGNDSNNGLSVSTPFATLQAAANVLMSLGTVGATRRIVLAAGTYSSAAARTARFGPANESETADPDSDPYTTGGINTVNYITIEGPDVGYDPQDDPDPVPTAIMEGGGAAAVGIQIEGPIKVLVKSIKFQNYDGSSSSGGIVGDGALIRCENVHGDGNYYDISGSRGRLEVKGGILANASGAAIRSIFNNKHEIGNQQAGATGQGPFINGAAIGVYAQEGATGHADYCSFTSCTDGIFATVNSRVNYTGSSFTSCTRGVRALQAYVFASSATFTSCGENKVIQMHGIDAPRDNYGNGGLATDYLNSTNTLTGTTTSTAILSKTLAAGDFAPNVTSIRKPQHIEGEAFGSQSGTAGTKQHKLRLGSTVLAVITNASSDAGDWHVRWSIYFLDSNVQSGYITYNTHLSSARVNVDTGTEDLAAAGGTLTYEQQLGNSADTVTTIGGHMKTWG